MMSGVNCTTKPKKYTHLTHDERVKIEVLLDEGKSRKEIASILGRSKSTIYDEINRTLAVSCADDHNAPVRYSAVAGDQVYAQNRFRSKPKSALVNFNEFINWADKMIVDKGFAPDACVGRAKLTNMFDKICCTKTLYNLINKNKMPSAKKENLLREGKRLERKKNPKVYKESTLGLSIEERPEIINNRSTFGHWEIDLIISTNLGSNGVLLTLTERLTRYEIIVKLPNKKSETINAAVTMLIEHYHYKGISFFKSITSDNGVEFTHLPIVSKDIPIYFAHPYKSNDRGTNENHNGIIRRFIPKGSLIYKYSESFIESIESWMNNYPRRIFDYYTPAEMLVKELKKLKQVA
jgi:IS30 family transposase